MANPPELLEGQERVVASDQVARLTVNGRGEHAPSSMRSSSAIRSAHGYRPTRVIIDSDHGEVRYFRMARTAFGRGLYWTDVYLVDGLLVDSGPANMQREVARLVAELDVLVGHPHRPRGRLSDPETHRASALTASDRGRDSGAGTDALCLCRRRPADAIPIARVDRADATRGLPA